MMDDVPRGLIPVYRVPPIDKSRDEISEWMAELPEDPEDDGYWFGSPNSDVSVTLTERQWELVLTMLEGAVSISHHPHMIGRAYISIHEQVTHDS